MKVVAAHFPAEGSGANVAAKALAAVDVTDSRPASEPLGASVAWARQQHAHALLLCGSGQPVTSEHLGALLELFEEQNTIAASYYDGRAGLPAVFPEAVLDALASADDEKAVLKWLRHARDVALIAWPEGGAREVEAASADPEASA